MRIALAAFTPGGAKLLARVTRALGEMAAPGGGCGLCGGDGGLECAVFDKSAASAADWVSREFCVADALVFIGATGIAVRLIAPFVRSKGEDPAVLVMDEKGEFVIPLLSGHIGGANRLARGLAERLDARAVITTATDLNGLFAVDEWSALSGCVVDDLGMVKEVSGALLRGEPVGFYSDFAVSGALPPGFFPGAGEGARVGVSVSLDATKKPFAATLNVVPQIAVLGAGCRKGADPAAFERFVLEELAACGIAVKAVRALASIDLKRDEPCMLEFAAKYGLEFRLFTAAELNAVQGSFTPSGFVMERTGTDNVCERAAAAGGNRVALGKTARAGMTLAVALAPWECAF